MPIGDRLKEARVALGLNQQQLADQCGVTMRSQRNYEKNERQPDAAYLSALVSVGIDVLYILTGQRSTTAISELRTELSPRKAALLDNYDQMTDADKMALERHALVLAQQTLKKGKTA